MADKREPTQRTPSGQEIPVPKRREFSGSLSGWLGKQVVDALPTQPGLAGDLSDRNASRLCFADVLA
jgi:hypothetical protein